LAACHKITIILALLITVPLVSHAGKYDNQEAKEIIIDDFENGLEPGWTSKSFKGETEYLLGQDEGQACLVATSHGTASGLVYKIEYDPEKYPVITWKWKIDKIIESGDATKKSGDDYAARLYVIFPSPFFVGTKTINYIWANRLPKGTAVPSPYTKNDFMVSVESGSENTGKWLTESRNVFEDYKRYFGKSPKKVGAVAIMTDTDDTKESASAKYGPISICTRKPAKKNID
jgi:hypothetical protein